MASLGYLYDAGIHFLQDKARAREYWERSAELGVNSRLNNLGLCMMNGTRNVEKNLPLARELFRRSTECLHNEAMSNLGVLHASLQEFETAARWADSAVKYGFLPASNEAERYRTFAKSQVSVPPELQDKLSMMMDMMSPANEEPDVIRLNETPTLEELRAISTPYGNRLLAAKEMNVEAMGALRSADPEKIIHAVERAIQAHRIDDSNLVFSEEEIRDSNMLAKLLQEAGMPTNAGLALLSSPTDPSSTVAFWKSLQLQFPEDLALTKRAACMHMFMAYPGADTQRGIQLFQRAFSLLPNPDDDSDPLVIDLLYVAGVAYFHAGDLKRAEGLLTRFLKFAPADGHRKANYILGMIAIKNFNGTPKTLRKVVSRYLREGDHLLKRFPPFLRRDAQESPNRKFLQSIAGAVTGSIPASLPASSSCRRCGALIDGPRRHAKLRSDSPTLQPKWRADIAAMVNLSSTKHSKSMSWSTKPARQSTAATRSGTYSPVTIDELFSALEDRVCMVISCSILDHLFRPLAVCPRHMLVEVLEHVQVASRSRPLKRIVCQERHTDLLKQVAHNLEMSFSAALSMARCEQPSLRCSWRKRTTSKWSYLAALSMASVEQASVRCSWRKRATDK